MTQRDRPGPVPADDADLAARRRWFVLAIAAVIGILPLFPPGVEEDDAPDAFSNARAQHHIGWIAAAPHPMGSSENIRVREQIADELESLGLVPEYQRLGATDWFDPEGAPVDVVNVVARIAGTSPTGAVAVVGHFDTVPTTPGANDNASAVAVMLEAARIIATGDPPRNDVIFVFTDGEEPAPRFGATAFVEHHRWSDDIGFVINLEAIGSGGPSMLVEVSGPASWVTEQYLDAVPYPTTYSFLTELTGLIGGSNTDFARFRDDGVPGVEMVYLRGSSIYHTMDDTPARVGSRSLYQHGANTVALLRHVGEIDVTESPDGSAPVLITVGRGLVIQYPSWSALGFVVAAGLAIGLSFTSIGEATRAAHDALMALGRALGLAIAGSVIWVLLAAWRSTMGVAEGYLYLVALGVLVAVGAIALDRARPSRRSPAGAATLWWFLAVAGIVVGPGASSLFVWAALYAGAALALRRWALSRTAVETAELLAIVSAVVLTIPAVDVFFQFAQPRPGNPESQITWTIVVSLLLIAVVIELFRSLGDPIIDDPPAATADRGDDDRATTGVL